MAKMEDINLKLTYSIDTKHPTHFIVFIFNNFVTEV